MRNFKTKITSALLAAIMLIGVFSPVVQAASMTNKEKIDNLVKNSIISGRTVDGAENDLALEAKITRAEMTKLAVYAMEKESLAEAVKETEGKFEDVGTSHWANGFINVASSGTQKIVKGYPDGTFGPNKNITYAEIAAILTRIVDPKIEDGSVSWPTTYTNAASKYNLLEGIKIENWNEDAQREQIFVMLYNTLEAQKEKLEKETGIKRDQNQFVGIVSNVVANRIEINQDSQMRYDLDFDTVYVNGVNPTVGSLVRIALDGKGNITHVVVLGTPNLGAYNKNRNWAGIADETVSTADFGTSTSTTRNAVIGKDTITVNGVKGIIDANTKIFVGEKALREVRDIKAAIGDKTSVPHVYMGYNKIGETGLVSARVIVFNDATVALPGESSVLRVTKPVDAMLEIEAETVKLAKAKYDVSRAGTSPFTSEGLEVNDIIELVVDKETKKVNGYDTLLNSKKAPVVLVTKIDKNTVTLKDSIGELDFYMLDSNNVFGSLAVGSHVQIVHNTKYGETNLLDYISVVSSDKKLTGHFEIENREYAKEVGTLVMYNATSPFNPTVTMYVNVKGKVNQYSVMNSSDIAFLEDYGQPGIMIEFTTLNVEGVQNRLAYNLSVSMQQSEEAKKIEEMIKEAIILPLTNEAEARFALARTSAIRARINAQPGIANQITPKLLSDLKVFEKRIDAILNPVALTVTGVEGVPVTKTVHTGETFSEAALPQTATLLLSDGTKLANQTIYWDISNWKTTGFTGNSSTFKLEGTINRPASVTTGNATIPVSTNVTVQRRVETPFQNLEFKYAGDPTSATVAGIMGLLPAEISVKDKDYPAENAIVKIEWEEVEKALVDAFADGSSDTVEVNGLVLATENPIGADAPIKGIVTK